MHTIILFIACILWVVNCSELQAIYFTENQPLHVFSNLSQAYGNNLHVFSSIDEFQQSKSFEFDYFFHADNNIVPQIAAPGKLVNVYFYKNTQQLAPPCWGNIDNLSSFDIIYTESLEDLKQFLEQANPILVQLARESKYVPLIRILFNPSSIARVVYLMSLELPFKEYIKEALPIFKNKAITIEPRINSDNVAVIVESAVHPALELVVRNVMYYLSTGWSLIIYHSEENEFFIKHALKDLSNIEYRLPFTPIYSVSEYNKFMKMHEFYESLAAKKVLIFQTDSLMLKSGIDKFMKYDYAGAPWPRSRDAGNGGFSLRSVDVMIEACIHSRNSTNSGRNEDKVFSWYIGLKHKIIPFEEAYKFSREIPVEELNHTTVEGGIYDAHLALHKTWNYSGPDAVRLILQHSLARLKHE